MTFEPLTEQHRQPGAMRFIQHQSGARNSHHALRTLHGTLILHVNHADVFNRVSEKLHPNGITIDRVQIKNIAPAAELAGIHNHAAAHVPQRQTLADQLFRRNRLPRRQVNGVLVHFLQGKVLQQQVPGRNQQDERRFRLQPVQNAVLVFQRVHRIHGEIVGRKILRRIALYRQRSRGQRSMGSVKNRFSSNSYLAATCGSGHTTTRGR